MSKPIDDLRYLQPTPQPACVLRKDSRVWLKSEIERLCEMRAQNMTCREIGEALGRSGKAVSGFLWRARQRGGLQIARNAAPETPHEAAFIVKARVRPKQYTDNSTCFRCGARRGRCEHT